MDRRFFTGAGGGLFVGLFASSAQAQPVARSHRVAFQISSGDAAVMNLVLGNVKNLADHYRALGEPMEVEIVAFGPGYAMLRDTSPVKGHIAETRDAIPAVVFSACQNSRRALAHAEGKSLAEVAELPGTTDVPSGVVRLNQLQEMGWTYLRP